MIDYATPAFSSLQGALLIAFIYTLKAGIRGSVLLAYKLPEMPA